MRRPLEILVCLLLLGAVAAAGAGAAARVLVPRSVVTPQLAYRPHSIVLSGDGTFSLSGIHWLSYGGATARARGRAYVRGCTPSCAEGEATRPRAGLRFTGIVRCRGARAYSRLRFVLHGRLPADVRPRGSLRLIGAGGC